MISILADGAQSVFAADMDGDEDLDVVSASASGTDSTVTWYENADGVGGVWSEHVISTTALYAKSVFAIDVDGDGDEDVLLASDRIAWYENTDGMGSFGPQREISNFLNAPVSVFAGDLDGDGDVDVISGSFNDDKIAWYENTDGMGSFSSQQMISVSADGVLSVFVSDVDGDGDLDVLSGSYFDGKTAWYENTDGAGTFGEQQIIANPVDQSRAVFAADFDGDGDTDVLAALFYGELMWYEQLNLANPLDPDSDDDGLLDGFEVANGFDPLAPGEEGMDPDADGLSNLAEQSAGTNPNNSDTDGDGFVDGDEVAAGSDPNLASSIPGSVAVPVMGFPGIAVLSSLLAFVVSMGVRRNKFRVYRL